MRILNRDLPENAAVEDFFRNVVDPVVRDIGFEPHEMGVGPNDHAWMNQAIFDDLHHSEAVVVDLTGLRTNCFMELGYTLGNVQRVVIAAQKGTSLPFDSSCLETHMWNPALELEEHRREFRDHWARNVNRPPLVKPRGLR